MVNHRRSLWIVHDGYSSISNSSARHSISVLPVPRKGTKHKPKHEEETNEQPKSEKKGA